MKDMAKAIVMMPPSTVEYWSESLK